MNKSKNDINKDASAGDGTEEELKRPVAFEIKFSDGVQRKESSVPSRLIRQDGTRTGTPQTIEEKLRNAEQRRNEQQRQRLRRMQQREEDCRRVTDRVKRFLGKDPDHSTKLPK